MKDKKRRDDLKIEVLLGYANSIIATLREPFLVLDKNLQVISANRVFYTTFKVTEKDAIGQLLPDLGNRQWNIPKLLQLLKEIIPEKKVVKDYEVEHKFEQIGERVMVLNACQLRVPKKIAGIIAAGIREEELILLAIEDITERKRLQGELKWSEERYRRAFETSHDGLLLVHKTEGDILNSNASAQELLGYSSEEFLKKKLWEFGVIKDDKDFQETVSRLEKDGVIHYEGTPVKTKKGLSINAEVFLVNKAKVLQCNIRDITERKRIEDELKQAKEQQYKTLIESLSGKVFLKDRNSVYISCNENYVRDLKIEAEEIKGKTDYDFYPKELAKKYRADDKRIMESKEAEEIEERYIQEGVEKIIQTVKTPIKDEKGNVTGILGIFWDITERKKMEGQLLSAAKEWRTTFDSISDLVSIHDKDFKITRVNRAFADAFDMNAQEVIGKNCYAVVHETKEPPSSCPHKQVMQTKKPISVEFFEPHLGIYLQITCSPVFGQGGEVVATVHLAKDITMHKEMEKEQRLAQLGKLVADMAHEVNNPLMIISGNAQLSLMENIQNEVISNNLKIIFEESKRAKDIIQRLLKFSRPSKGELQVTDINKSIEAVLSIVEHQFNLANIEIKRNYADNLPPISIDEHQMQEVLMNLLNNANDAMPKSGVIEVTTSLEGYFLRIDFKDTGCGMSEGVMKRLFEPFFTTKEKGTGLGLSVCYGIIKVHNGDLKFES
ncbi:MAG: PAS domain S-box protein, partial [Candidatus Helarchaeota archaeon]|nr:PAS domain S-box protein [Candidatus Helarchaeota archaeon]